MFSTVITPQHTYLIKVPKDCVHMSQHQILTGKPENPEEITSSVLNWFSNNIWK